MSIFAVVSHKMIFARVSHQNEYLFAVVFLQHRYLQWSSYNIDICSGQPTRGCDGPPPSSCTSSPMPSSSSRRPCPSSLCFERWFWRSGHGFQAVKRNKQTLTFTVTILLNFILGFPTKSIFIKTLTFRVTPLTFLNASQVRLRLSNGSLDMTSSLLTYDNNVHKYTDPRIWASSCLWFNPWHGLCARTRPHLRPPFPREGPHLYIRHHRHRHHHFPRSERLTRGPATTRSHLSKFSQPTQSHSRLML